MKLKKRSNKKTLIIIGAIILAVILLISAAIIIVTKVDEANGKIMTSMQISSYPSKLTYYVGETFDPTGIRVQVIAKNGSSTVIRDPSELTFSGFDSSSAVKNQVITVSYMGVSTRFRVNISNPPSLRPTLESISVSGCLVEYTLDDWQTYGFDARNGVITCHYSDGSTTEVVLGTKYVKNEDREIQSPGTTYITVQYSDGVTMVETQVEITITE